LFGYIRVKVSQTINLCKNQFYDQKATNSRGKINYIQKQPNMSEPIMPL